MVKAAVRYHNQRSWPTLQSPDQSFFGGSELGKTSGIVLDPTRSFGQPIDDGTGIPTRVLANAATAEGSTAAAAKARRVSAAVIRRALNFERTLARAA
jgi:uncharacterized protein (DUF433 family)